MSREPNGYIRLCTLGETVSVAKLTELHAGGGWAVYVRCSKRSVATRSLELGVEQAFHQRARGAARCDRVVHAVTPAGRSR